MMPHRMLRLRQPQAHRKFPGIRRML